MALRALLLARVSIIRTLAALTPNAFPISESLRLLGDSFLSQ